MSQTLTVTLSRLSAILIFICLMTIATFPVWARESTSGATNRRDKIQGKVETRGENIQDRIETKREKMASREAQLRAKLQKFKDKRKAEVADRVNTNLNRINQNQTQQMLKHLEKMTAILNKLENRVNQGAPDIKDPAAARIAIASAGNSLASASAAVAAQALNDYTIIVTSEATVKANAKASRDRLHADLLAVRKLVIDAKQAVANAIRVAKSGKMKEGTESGQQ